jgi:DNA ligase (NAD+)
MSKTMEQRIAYLKLCSNDYYTTGKSELTDAEYDVEYDALKDLAPTHTFFGEVGGIDESHLYGTKVQHEVVMGSLNKSKDVDDFLMWLQATYKETIEVVLQHKVDGLSLGCTYKNGMLQRAVTRGDGITGVDVTPNAKFVQGVLPTIDSKDKVEVRGECYKDRQDFYRDWAGEYANPRNFTAGSINQKNPKVTEERGLSFVAYEVVGKDFATETQKLKFIMDNGFINLRESTKKITGDVKEVAAGVKQYMDAIDRSKLPYDIDGIVVKINDIKKAKALGSTNEGKRPRANRAVKFACEQRVTSVVDIEWNIGRTGQLTPVGLLKPVELGGTIVKRVSLHNIKFMSELKLRPNAKVLLQKSGDIIPYVVKMVQDGSGQFRLPSHCPSCNSILEWDETKTTKWCHSSSCPAQLASTIEHWFKKLGVKGIGSGIIEKLLGSATVNSIADMYDLERHAPDLSELFGAKAFQNIVESVNSVREVSLAKFIESLGIGQIGRMSKDIAAIAPTVDKIDALKVSDIATLDGFAETKAKSFVNGWQQQRKEIEKLLKHISLIEVKADSNRLTGKKFCFTGSFDNPKRKDMEASVEANGGNLSSVSKNLTALVWDGEMQGSKIDKAKKLGIKIINQQQFLDMLK